MESGIVLSEKGWDRIANMPLSRVSKSPFCRIAERYDEHAALEQEVLARLLERTSFIRQSPVRILDLGCGTGQGSAGLKQQFRKAQVIGLDISPAMLERMCRRSSMLRPLRPVCADMGALPFAARSMDLVFSNLAGFWCPQPTQMFSEIRRVIRPGGMFLFSTFGPATLAELARAWGSVDARVEVPTFPDLLETGDALVAAGFTEPVMDMEKITLSYGAVEALLEELEATGTSMLIRDWERGRQSIEALRTAFRPLLTEGRYPLSFEIVYGTAFGPQEGQPVKTPEGDIATFSVESLLKTRE